MCKLPASPHSNAADTPARIPTGRLGAAAGEGQEAANGSATCAAAAVGPHVPPPPQTSAVWRRQRFSEGRFVFVFVFVNSTISARLGLAVYCWCLLPREHPSSSSPPCVVQGREGTSVPCSAPCCIWQDEVYMDNAHSVLVASLPYRGSVAGWLCAYRVMQCT